ncbi:hypothetical protein ACFFKU_10405 [Kineococcus gynurae]|uniref:Uncharacterized protein n=1 Tax=Kineococcus gynurae TaxID=452979 RepID=A0ABV5LV34_9ACTN
MYETRRRHGPPGWPEPVPPVGAEGWDGVAVAWLLDQAPPEYRSYPVVRRHPVLLAWLVAHHVRAQREAVRSAVSTARRDLAHQLEPQVGPQVMEMLEAEELRLRRVDRAVGLLGEALSGRTFVPRL